MTLSELHKHLKSHTGEELFGDRGKDHPNYRKWAKICHPDVAKKGEYVLNTFSCLEIRARESTAILTRIKNVSNKLRYVVTVIDHEHNDSFLPGKRTYKILDLDTDTVGLASYKSRERAQDVTDKQNAKPKLIYKNVHFPKNKRK